MYKHIFFLTIVMTMSSMASAATASKANSDNITWSVSTGLGFDSNAYQAPRAPYIDYAALPLGTNLPMNPQKKSGFFVPYDLKAEMKKNRNQDSRLLGTATADGSLYLGSLSNASEYNLRLSGGTEYILAHDEKAENTFYVGALLGKHRQIYVDHDSGLAKTTTISGTDISGRYNYMNYGVEAKYKHKIGSIAYGFIGQFVLNDYEAVAAVAQLDHSYYRLGADASVPVADQTKLELSYDHSARDYSSKHARDAQGVYSSLNNPLLSYSYNSYGVTLRNQVATGWLLYLDYDRNTRADSFVGYDDYTENRYGARLLYSQDHIKARLAFHHWGRDYPNGFAFDVPAQGAKTYSGNVLKLKAEMERAQNSAYWAELAYKSQNTTDLRYDYTRAQIMAGMSWAY